MAGESILFIHAASTLFMTGLICFVQVPLHRRLLAGNNGQVVQHLARSSCQRTPSWRSCSLTALWSLRGGTPA